MADFYDQPRQQLAAGVPWHSAVEATASIYLDGKRIPLPHHPSVFDTHENMLPAANALC